MNKHFLYIITLLIFSLNIAQADIQNAEEKKFFQNVNFLGVYSTGKEPKCLIFIGEEKYINTQRQFVTSQTEKPLQVILIGENEDTVLMSTIDNFESRFVKKTDDSSKFEIYIYNLSVMDVVKKIAAAKAIGLSGK